MDATIVREAQLLEVPIRQFVYGVLREWTQSAMSPGLALGAIGEWQAANRFGRSESKQAALANDRAFGLAPAPAADRQEVVLTRDLLSTVTFRDQRVFQQHHVVVDLDVYRTRLRCNFGPLAAGVWSRDEIPFYPSLQTLPEALEVEVWPEPQRLSQLWAQFADFPQQVTALLQALFLPTPTIVVNFPGDEQQRLDLLELVLLLLPLSLRGQFAFATRVFRLPPDRPRIVFGSYMSDYSILDWQSGRLDCLDGEPPANQCFAELIAVLAAQPVRAALEDQARVYPNALRELKAGGAAVALTYLDLIDSALAGAQLWTPDAAARLDRAWWDVTDELLTAYRLRELPSHEDIERHLRRGGTLKPEMAAVRARWLTNQLVRPFAPADGKAEAELLEHLSHADVRSLYFAPGNGYLAGVQDPEPHLLLVDRLSPRLDTPTRAAFIRTLAPLARQLPAARILVKIACAYPIAETEMAAVLAALALPGSGLPATRRCLEWAWAQGAAVRGPDIRRAWEELDGRGPFLPAMLRAALERNELQAIDGDSLEPLATLIGEDVWPVIGDLSRLFTGNPAFVAGVDERTCECFLRMAGRTKASEQPAVVLAAGLTGLAGCLALQEPISSEALTATVPLFRRIGEVTPAPKPAVPAIEEVAAPLLKYWPTAPRARVAVNWRRLQSALKEFGGAEAAVQKQLSLLVADMALAQIKKKQEGIARAIPSGGGLTVGLAEVELDNVYFEPDEVAGQLEFIDPRVFCDRVRAGTDLSPATLPALAWFSRWLSRDGFALHDDYRQLYCDWIGRSAPALIREVLKRLWQKRPGDQAWTLFMVQTLKAYAHQVPDDDRLQAFVPFCLYWPNLTPAFLGDIFALVWPLVKQYRPATFDVLRHLAKDTQLEQPGERLVEAYRNEGFRLRTEHGDFTLDVQFLCALIRLEHTKPQWPLFDAAALQLLIEELTRLRVEPSSNHSTEANQLAMLCRKTVEGPLLLKDGDVMKAVNLAAIAESSAGCQKWLIAHIKEAGGLKPGVAAQLPLLPKHLGVEQTGEVVSAVVKSIHKMPAPARFAVALTIARSYDYSTALAGAAIEAALHALDDPRQNLVCDVETLRKLMEALPPDNELLIASLKPRVFTLSRGTDEVKARSALRAWASTTKDAALLGALIASHPKSRERREEARALWKNLRTAQPQVQQSKLAKVLRGKAPAGYEDQGCPSVVLEAWEAAIEQTTADADLKELGSELSVLPGDAALLPIARAIFKRLLLVELTVALQSRPLGRPGVSNLLLRMTDYLRRNTSEGAPESLAEGLRAAYDAALQDHPDQGVELLAASRKQVEELAKRSGANSKLTAAAGGHLKALQDEWVLPLLVDQMRDRLLALLAPDVVGLLAHIDTLGKEHRAELIKRLKADPELRQVRQIYADLKKFVD